MIEFEVLRSADVPLRLVLPLGPSTKGPVHKDSPWDPLQRAQCIRISLVTLSKGSSAQSISLGTSAKGPVHKASSWNPLSPFLTGRMFVRPNILRTLRRTMIRFLTELLVRRIWFGQSKLYFILNWLVMRCKLRPELAADMQQTA